MATIKSHKYRIPLGKQMTRPGRFVTGEYDHCLMANVLFDFAHARRNQLSTYLNQTIRYNDSGTGALITNSKSPSAANLYCIAPTPQQGGSANLIRPMPIGHSVEPKFANKFWLYVYSPDWADETTNVTLYCGIGSKSGSVTVDAVGPAWYEVDVPALDYYEPDAYLYIQAASKNLPAPVCLLGANAYQVAASGLPTYIDIDASSQKLGTEDYPISTCRLGILHDHENWVWGNRVPRSNLLAHYAQGIGVATDVVGRYRFVKRARVAQLKLYINAMNCAFTTEPVTEYATLSVKIADHSGTEIGDSPKTMSVHTNPILTTDVLTFDLTGTEDTNENYWEMTLTCADGTAPSSIYINTISLVEVPDAAFNITMANVESMATGTEIRASQYELIRKVLLLTERSSGMKVCCSDYRCGQSYGVSFLEPTCIKKITQIDDIWQFGGVNSLSWSLSNMPVDSNHMTDIQSWDSGGGVYPFDGIADPYDTNAKCFDVPLFVGPGASIISTLHFAHDDMNPAINPAASSFDGSCAISALITNQIVDYSLADTWEFGRDTLPQQYQVITGATNGLNKHAKFFPPASMWNLFSYDTQRVFMTAYTFDDNQTWAVYPWWGQVYEPALIYIPDIDTGLS